MERSKVISVSSGNLVTTREDRLIGAILVQSGRLKPEDNERILLLQREQGLRFGDAAVHLRLLTQADIEFALSEQFNYPYLLRGNSSISEDLIAAYAPSGPHLEALRALRGELMLRWFDVDPSQKALAVVSGERREGRSFIVANLAVAFALLGKRTLLIDADMRNACQQNLFALDNHAGLSAILSGRGGPELIQRIHGLLELSILPAGVRPPNPLELLAQPTFSQLLNDLSREFDVILLDSPATAECGDAQTIAVRAGAALIVARKNVTRMWRVRNVSDTVAKSRAIVVGAVLNDF